MKIRGIYLIMVCIFLSACQNPDLRSGKTIKVERVVSGQTIEIADRSAAVPILEPIRLLGISAPDIRQQPWGQQAKTELERLTLGQEVLLESDFQDKDKFGRQLGYVWLRGILVNEYMVAQGWALAEADFSNTKYIERLANAQEKARLLGLGIWNPEQPMRQAPAQFRSQNL
ncbi:MAG: thermonuclease family protein [Microcoleaceae cyanobacterium MO_207.B10]|nr:thermonuclease family protein [Microcoleaceae cyanobacterium MO_207.B10]